MKSLNCMVKNEAILLEHVLPIWSTYPVDEYIFFNDHSTDATKDVIIKHLGERARIIDNPKPTFDEAYNRQCMLDESRGDWILSIDSDELLTANFWQHQNLVFNDVEDVEHRVFCYNLAGNWRHRRCDPAYKSNYLCMTARRRDVHLNLNLKDYHTQRRLPSKAHTVQNIKLIGNIHLQSLNPSFYALKQLWYKHWEYHNLGKKASKINANYDKVVHGLKWPTQPLSEEHKGNLYIDPTVFDGLAVAKGYKQYIQNNLVPELVTFGHKYLYA